MWISIYVSNRKKNLVMGDLDHACFVSFGRLQGHRIWLNYIW